MTSPPMASRRRTRRRAGFPRSGSPTRRGNCPSARRLPRTSLRVRFAPARYDQLLL
jgi:hypothetical protein